jgi:hypothetical protein
VNFLGTKRNDFHELTKQKTMSKKSESINPVTSTNEKEPKEIVGAHTLQSKSTLKIKKSESVFFHLSIDYKKSLEKFPPKNRKILKFFFYCRNLYFWISVENLIAFVLLVISQIISSLEDKIQRMILFICFSVVFLMYQKLEPFELKMNNTIASFSIAIALWTIIFQMIGANENNSQQVIEFSVGMIIFLNMFFYLGCGFLIILQKNEKLKKKLLSCIKVTWRTVFGCFKR